MNGAVPHSGNLCSGLCRAPCGHNDCWQCNEVKQKAERKKHTSPDCNDLCRVPCGHSLCKDCFNHAHNEARMAARAAYKSQGTSILNNLPAQGPGDTQKVAITRAALEGLCQRAGVRLDWNDGDPIFHDERGWESAKSWSANGKGVPPKTFEDHVRQLADTKLSEDLRKSLDQATRDRAKLLEEQARQKLRDAGASEADIEATVALMGWEPPKGD